MVRWRRLGSTKTTVFYLYKNATTSTFFDFDYYNEAEGLGEVATNNCTVTSVNPIACFPTKTEIERDLTHILSELRPQESLTIAAEYPSGSAVDVTASINWEDDL